MGIERLVFACCKIGIDKNASGGQRYSYTEGMKELLADQQLGISSLEKYQKPKEPMSFTYKQLDTLFPKQFRYKAYTDGTKTLFAFSNNKASIDWGKFESYEAYLEASKDENAVVEGRSGASEFYILAGEMDELTDFPCRYYQSEALKSPYTGENFCSSKKPDYMQPLTSITPGATITKESIRQFLTEESGRADILKKMTYCLLRYNSQAGYVKNLVICDEQEKIIDWIAAISFLFSENLAKKISFSTYEYSPVGTGYRICGAYPNGTDYNPNASNGASYVFDILSEKFEEVEIREKEFYGFLVNSFLYAPDSLDKFYEFIAKFCISEVSVELEDAFELYNLVYLNKGKQSTELRELKKAVDFAKHCTDDAEIKKILYKFIPLYLGAKFDKADEGREIIVDLFKHFQGMLSDLEQPCAERFVNKLVPSPEIHIDEAKAVYKECEQLFQKSGGNLFPAYYKAFLQKADLILNDNSDLPHNRYIAEIIYRHIRENNIDISDILSSSCTEGKLLKKIVGNIILQNVTESELKECIEQLIKPYRAMPKKYLYLIRALKEMANEYSGGSVQQWTDILEDCIRTLITSENSGQTMQIYDALIELGYEEKVWTDIERRSKEENEPFGLIFADVKALLAPRYEGKFQPKEMCEILIKAAEDKQNPQQNLKKVLEFLLVTKKSNTLSLDTADKFVEQMDLSADAADKPFIDKLIALYKEYGESKAKLAAVSVLQEMDEELEKDIKYVSKKYGQAVRQKTLEFPEVSEAMKNQFLDDFASKIVELYVLCGEIRVIHYYNNLFQLGDTERLALMEYELRLAINEGNKQDTTIICRLIAYSIITRQQIQADDMAEILNKSKMNINKMDKCFDENNKDFLDEIYEEINFFNTSEQDRKELLLYWNDVYQTVNQKNPGFIKKIMDIFKRNEG